MMWSHIHSSSLYIKARKIMQKPKGLRSLPETSPWSERSTTELSWTLSKFGCSSNQPKIQLYSIGPSYLNLDSRASKGTRQPKSILHWSVTSAPFLFFLTMQTWRVIPWQIENITLSKVPSLDPHHFQEPHQQRTVSQGSCFPSTR